MADPHCLRRCFYCFLIGMLCLGTVSGAEVSDQNMTLHDAVRNGDIKRVEQLITEGADINSIDQSQTTPLHIAADTGRADIVRLLLSKGAYVDSVGGRLQATALHYAAAGGHMEIVEMLIKAKADINAWDSQGFRPLHYAVQYGHIMVVKFLLQNNADIHVRTEQGVTPLMFAVLYNHRGIEYLLVSRGAKPDILCAVIRGDAGRVSALLAQDPSRANTYAYTDDYWTPLFWAVFLGYVDVVKVLISASADIENQIQHVTPLYWAVRKGHTSIARYLLDKGANINAKMGNDVTALHNVSTKACAQLLLDRGADVNAKDSLGRTPLHSILSIEGHWITLDVIRTRRSRGMRVLEQLAIQEQAIIAKMLIAHGADINAEDNNGYTPLRLAELLGYKTLAEQINTYVENRKPTR